MTAFDNIVLAELVSTVVYTFIGAGLLLACWWIVEWLTPFSLRDEINVEKNMAIAVLMASLFVSLSIIIAAVILS